MLGHGVLKWAIVFLGIVALVCPAATGEAPTKENTKEAEPTKKSKEPERKVAEPPAESIVAKVDDIVITRDDLNLAQRQLRALNPQAPLPNNQQLVEQLIERVLWQRYFEKQGLRASGPEIQRAIQQLDAELRQRGSSYQRWIAALGLTAEEHAALISFDLSSARLRERIRGEMQEEEIKREFDAHPEWYDGSRIRVSQIFINTADILYDPDKLKKAKERIDKIYEELKAGKDFGKLARDYTEDRASEVDGDRGWFTRKGAEEDEPLIAAAWNLKVGEFTKPIQGARGWHILKVTDREPARFTPFGARPNVIAELIRRRIATILDELKAKATIVRNI